MLQRNRRKNSTHGRRTIKLSVNKTPALVLVPSISEEEEINNGEKLDRDVAARENYELRMYIRQLRPSECLGSFPNFF